MITTKQSYEFEHTVELHGYYGSLGLFVCWCSVDITRRRTNEFSSGDVEIELTDFEASNNGGHDVSPEIKRALRAELAYYCEREKYALADKAGLF